MDLKHRVYFLFIFSLTINKFVFGQDYCDPFNAAATDGAVEKASFSNSCACSYPCTVDKVGEFVQFYYTKK